MISDDERREVARRLREKKAECEERGYPWMCDDLILALGYDHDYEAGDEIFDRLADIIEPSHKPDAEYEAWYNKLSHYGDERGGPSTIRELIEEIIWTALTVDLGPNGNTDPTGVDKGRVYTDRLFAEWEREALRLSGGIDRDALLALAGILRTPEQDADCGACPLRKWCDTELYNGHRITCFECKTWHTADAILEACGEQAS